jgi:hypothetical protein
MAAVLDQAFPGAAGITPDVRTNSLVIRCRSADTLAELKKVIEQLDVPGGREKE